MAPSPEILGRRLREYRRAKGLSQPAVAAHLGLNRSAVGKLEAGTRHLTATELETLTRLFGCTARDLLAPEISVLDEVLRDLGPMAGGELGKALAAAVEQATETTALERLLSLSIDRPSASLVGRAGAPVRADTEALRQGENLARAARQRLSLGDLPIIALARLLETRQGIRTAALPLPPDVAGLTLRQESFGVLVAVRQDLDIERQRFALAHEYGHVLADGGGAWHVTRPDERRDLHELRANAFAAALLLPAEGVREELRSLGKGQPRRIRAAVWDEENIVTVDTDARQELTLDDIVRLSSVFGVSLASVAYRLRNVDLLDADDAARFVMPSAREAGRAAATALGLPAPSDGGDASHVRLLALTAEASRLGLIDGESP